MLTSTRLYYSEETTSENDDDIEEDTTSMDGMEVTLCERAFAINCNFYGCEN